MTVEEDAWDTDGFVTPAKVMMKELPLRRLPESNVMVINEPAIETAPVRVGLPGGENKTLVPLLQLKIPDKVMTIFPLTGIALAGVITTVIEIPAPRLAGFDSVTAGDCGPKESVSTSQMSIRSDTAPANPPPR